MQPRKKILLNNRTNKFLPNVLQKSIASFVPDNQVHHLQLVSKTMQHETIRRAIQLIERFISLRPKEDFDRYHIYLELYQATSFLKTHSNLEQCVKVLKSSIENSLFAYLNESENTIAAHYPQDLLCQVFRMYPQFFSDAGSNSKWPEIRKIMDKLTSSQSEELNGILWKTPTDSVEELISRGAIIAWDTFVDICSLTYFSVSKCSLIINATRNLNLHEGLYLAIVHGNLNMVKALVARGANPNVQFNDLHKSTPLSLALTTKNDKLNKSDIALFLLSAGTKPEEANYIELNSYGVPYVFNAYQLAKNYDHPAVVKIFEESNLAITKETPTQPKYNLVARGLAFFGLFTPAFPPLSNPETPPHLTFPPP